MFFCKFNIHAKKIKINKNFYIFSQAIYLHKSLTFRISYDKLKPNVLKSDCDEKKDLTMKFYFRIRKYGKIKNKSIFKIFLCAILICITAVCFFSCKEDIGKSKAEMSDEEIENLLKSIFLNNLTVVEGETVLPTDFYSGKLSDGLKLSLESEILYQIGKNNLSFVLSYKDISKRNLTATLEVVKFNRHIELALGSEETVTEGDFFEHESVVCRFIDFNPNEIDRNKVSDYSGKIQIGDKTYDITVSVADKEPPVFKGLKNITIVLGGTVSYKSGVSVTDNSGEDIQFSVDSSRVNKNAVGEYEIIYSAKDSSGNETRETVIVSVVDKSYEATVKLIEKKLSSIIRDGMTNDEKIKAIWSFSKDNIRYTGQSNKSAEYIAAYDSLTTGGGDCYSYYAVNEMMFEALGIEHYTVTRVNGDSNHWWHLVKFDDGMWYFVDSCPPPSPILNKYGSFYKMTNSQIAGFTEEVEKVHKGWNYYGFDKSLYSGLNIAE